MMRMGERDMKEKVKIIWDRISMSHLFAQDYKGLGNSKYERPAAPPTQVHKSDAALCGE